MSVFDIDKNIESIDGNIREYEINQLNSNRSIKFVKDINDLKYLNNLHESDLVYVVECNEVYIYMNEWIKAPSYYGNI